MMAIYQTTSSPVRLGNPSVTVTKCEFFITRLTNTEHYLEKKRG